MHRGHAECDGVVTRVRHSWQQEHQNRQAGSLLGGLPQPREQVGVPLLAMAGTFHAAVSAGAPRPPARSLQRRGCFPRPAQRQLRCVQVGRVLHAFFHVLHIAFACTGWEGPGALATACRSVGANECRSNERSASRVAQRTGGAAVGRRGLQARAPQQRPPSACLCLPAAPLHAHRAARASVCQSRRACPAQCSHWPHLSAEPCVWCIAGQSIKNQMLIK